jgi:hypothetical protein
MRFIANKNLNRRPIFIAIVASSSLSSVEFIPSGRNYGSNGKIRIGICNHFFGQGNIIWSNYYQFKTFINSFFE